MKLKGPSRKLEDSAATPYFFFFNKIYFSPRSAGHEHRPARDETQRGAQGELKIENNHLLLENYYFYYYLYENAGFPRQVLLHHGQGHPRCDGDPGGAGRKRIKVIFENALFFMNFFWRKYGFLFQ